VCEFWNSCPDSYTLAWAALSSLVNLRATFIPSARFTLVAAALGFAIVILDVSVVNVALSALHAELAADIEGLQWVITAYTLVFAALLLSTGVLGDRFGPRRMFLAGLWVFSVASAACALSTSLPQLIAGRLVFVFSLYFQLEQHLSAQLTGVAFLPMTAVLMAANVLAGQLVTRWGFVG
jgi:MFS family permease